MPVSPVYCKMILRPGPPLCGFYVGGVFRKPLRLLSLDALKRQLHGGPEACFSRATYNGRQSNATLVASEVGGASDAEFEVRPAACPSYRYFSPRAALSILHHASIGRNGRGILVTGDSMMRQFLLRLMFFLRGEEVFAEQYFHHDAMYVVYEDRDELILDVACQHKSLLDTYFPGYMAPSLENSTCRQAAPLGGRVDPPVHLASFMYWWKRGVSQPNDIDRYLSRVRDRAGGVVSGPTVVSDYVYYTVPWTSNTVGHVLPEGARVFRNARAYKLIEEMDSNTSAGVAARRRVSLVDFAAIADVRHMERTMDQLHFMCIWLPEYPLRVAKQKKNGIGCRDPVNLALLQWTLHLLWARGFAS
ncbi:hypothetical protein LSM04_004275 [Trypanosoma melophagium]|uniref:uncharacterized protein n=1 Tax=Trypanosoma melophagium TaxID=715481 RepID=UPI003519DCB0|nr:hypothetical protein LSM04_004275 [Trypanosoma melophagium]